MVSVSNDHATLRFKGNYHNLPLYCLPIEIISNVHGARHSHYVSRGFV